MKKSLNGLKSETPRFSLVHNDSTGNEAIFDWDMTTLGDPLNDLGALLTYWRESNDPSYIQVLATMPNGDLGFMSRKELTKRYCEKCGLSAENIKFYHTLGLFRLTGIITQIYIRFVRK
ncbi:MAG: phosphotransferase [Candidatus Hodarchaeota archaeon]